MLRHLPSRRRFGAALAALAAAAALGGCGFHLRGETSLPFRTLYVQGQEGTPLAAELSRALRHSSNTRLVDKAEGAEAILHIMSNQSDKQILTLSSGGKVREFLLTQKLVFRVHNGKGAEWLPTSELIIKRDFSFSDTQALAKEAEERLLLQDMQTDAVQQLLRRLGAASKSPTPA